MKVNLVGCLFVLENEKNSNIRKNDIKKLKILVNKNRELPKIEFNNNGMKNQVRKNLTDIIGSKMFHLEQVFSLDYDNDIDVIYLAITNIEYVNKLNHDYELIDFKIENNNTIIFGDKRYKYKTVEKEENNNIEYIHEIDTKDNNIKRILLNLLISYKKIRNNIDNTDIMFKFMGSTFTLEDVRILYELIKESSVDKSNFRKKIMKYCEKTETTETAKIGYRPSQKYKFKPLKGDVWI